MPYGTEAECLLAGISDYVLYDTANAVKRKNGVLELVAWRSRERPPETANAVKRKNEVLELAAWRSRENTGGQMADLVNIGFGNLVNAQKVVAVVNPDAAPIKRLVQNARETQSVIDATQGRRTKSVLIMETDQIILSAMQPDTIGKRFAANHMTEQEWKGEEQ